MRLQLFGQETPYVLNNIWQRYVDIYNSSNITLGSIKDIAVEKSQTVSLACLSRFSDPSRFLPSGTGLTLIVPTMSPIHIPQGL